jgi:raffinose/stachyose/melibiose transport system permease protein
MLGNREGVSQFQAKIRMASGSKHKTLMTRIRENWQIYLYLLPTFVLLGIFTYYPAFSAIYHSFFNWRIGGATEFIGLANFQRMLTDPAMIAGIGVVGKLILWSVTVPLFVPLLAAELIFHLSSNKFRNFYRTSLILPMVIPGIVTLLLWGFIYSSGGLLNAVLDLVGLGELRRVWLNDPRTALYAYMAMGIPWAGGFSMLIYYSGLAAIPESLFDAAKIDGASWWQRLMMVDLPLLVGQIRLLLVLSMLVAIQSFEGILVLTDGGPGYSTMVPGLRMYNVAFSYGEMGYASAIGMVMFVAVLAFTVVLMKSVREGDK